MPERRAQLVEEQSGTLLLYSWQPIRQLAGTDGSRHAGMAQRLMQVVRAACRPRARLSRRERCVRAGQDVLRLR